MALYNIPIHLYINLHDNLHEVLIEKTSSTYWKLEGGKE
jgi:hypothetical protein